MEIFCAKKRFEIFTLTFFMGRSKLDLDLRSKYFAKIYKLFELFTLTFIKVYKHAGNQTVYCCHQLIKLNHVLMVTSLKVIWNTCPEITRGQNFETMGGKDE